MDYQQPHGYMRPPPPPPPPPPAPAAPDPYNRPPPPVHPQQSNYPWPYPAPQFQYQPQAQLSPSPPPPQWAPPPPQSADHVQFLPPPYAAHQPPPPYPGNPRYPPPHPLQPRPLHLPQSQDWASGGWTHHQNWQYPSFHPAANNNEEDWAAKARAWAAAKAANDNQQGQSQFVLAGMPEEQSHFHDQYSQSHDGHLLAPASNYQQYPVGHPNITGQGQMQDSQYISSGQSSYAAGLHVAFASRDGGSAGDSVPPSQQQDKSSMSPLSHQQEVPSSYSSVAGKDGAGEKLSCSASLPVISVSQHQSLPPAGGRAGWMEESPNLHGSQPAEPVTDLSDQPLNFAPHFNRDTHAQPIYTHSSGPGRGGDPAVPIPSNYAWNTSSVPGAVYPPVPPIIPTGPQVDHPTTIHSPVSGHSAPMFPAGQCFQPTVPMMGPAFGVGTGAMPHPSAFSGDAYGVSDRPKKAAVPNWVREEIIKNKAVITSSAPLISKEDSQSIDEDSNDKSYRKGDQADSKSIDSSRSTEDEDEDEVEAARTAAINREIKRVLTEILLKVTDELFDEIATKILKEDELSVEVGRDMDLPENHVFPPVSTPKASAKVLISTKTKENDNEDGSEKSTSGAGDILGLASYASDEEDEIQSSSLPNSKENAIYQQSSSSKHLEDHPVIDNDGSQAEIEEQGNVIGNLANDVTGRKSPGGAYPGRVITDTEVNDNRADRGLVSISDHSSRGLSGIVDRIAEGYERLDVHLDARSLINDDPQTQYARNRSDKTDRLESNKSLAKKENKDSEISKERFDKKGHDAHRRYEERHVKTDRIGDLDISNDKGTEKNRTNEKVKHTESRKRPSPSTGEEGAETPRDKRTTLKNDSGDKKQDRTRDEKEERSRHRGGSESRRHKRHLSSDESSDDSKRKSRHSKRHKSPSPIRSRKRQVSRSPHNKHSKRRHSPYSSLETMRGGKRSASKSRSRSPVHRRR